MDISEKEIQAALSNSKKQIVDSIVEHLKERMIHDIKYASNDRVELAIKEFMDNEIIPEFKKSLHTNKAFILKELENTSVSIGTEVSKAVMAKVIANMHGYRGGEILKKLVE